jgi:hypothetical protein
MLQIAGLLDQFTGTVTLEYLDLLLRVDSTGFVFANVETPATDEEASGIAGAPGREPSGSAASAD